MSGSRRNSISFVEERYVLAIAAASSLLAIVAGAEPTGGVVIDALLVAGFAALVTWAGASAPWWALLVGSGLATAGAIGGPVAVLVPAIGAVGASVWIGSERANRPLARAAIAAVVTQVVLRLEWDPFFLSSALLAAAATGVIAVSGARRRKRHLRKRVWVGTLVVGGLAAFAVAGLGLAAVQAQADARDGYDAMLDGLEFVQNGDVPEAAEALRRAAVDLDAASDTLDSPVSQLARAVPGLAQNRNAATEVLRRAAESAEAAATTLEFVDLDQLTVRDGVVDVGAFAALEQPLADLEATIVELDDALRDAATPWLVAPFQNRLDDALERADQLVPQARATAAAARIAPAMLGADGERRYLVAFVNAAEARGHSGLMGNWNEITITNGRLEVTATGRTADLQAPALRDLALDASDEYLNRYALYGARQEGGVALKYWSNVTMTPDMPSVGNAMAQMYETATGRPVDGVVVVDGAGIAALIGVAGPVALDDIGRTVDASNAERFVVIDQYEFAENEREDLLTTITEQTIDNVLAGSLPSPQRMASILAPAVVEGHLSGWAIRPEEQELFDLVGMDASLPVVTAPGVDALAVSNNNAGGSKIDSFLHRTIEYRPVVDPSSGRATATLRIELTNDAPATGLPEYVIGGLFDSPPGTNRMLVDVYTRLGADAIRVDGEQPNYVRARELGYEVNSVVIDVPSGETAVLELELSGELGEGPYRLVYRPQPLPNSDRLVVEARTAGGDTIFDFDDSLFRRSVLDANGVAAWRQLVADDAG